MNKKEDLKVIRVDRAFAQGDNRPVKKRLIRYIDGKRVQTMVKYNSPNQERINDAVVWLFQYSVKKQYDYYKYREEAIEELEDKFIEHDLTYNNLEYDKKRIKAAAIQQVIDNKILTSLDGDPILSVDFEEVLNISKLKSCPTFKGQIETILSIVGRGNKEFKRDLIDLDSMNIESTSFIKRVEIIGVNVIIDPEIGKHFPTIDLFKEAKINPLTGKTFRNKKKYIKEIQFVFSKDVIPSIVCQGTNYVSLFPTSRSNYKLQNTFAIDTYVTSIEYAQHYRHYTDFSPDDLQKKFGHSYKDFSKYLRQVIDTCVEDFNNNNTRKLSYILKRKGYAWGDSNASNNNQIEKFRWVIENYEKSPRDDVDDISYYVAFVILMDDNELNNKFESIKAFAISISEQINSDIPSLTVLAGKTISEWIDEAEKELKIESEIIAILNNSDSLDITYDRTILSIVSDKYDIKNINTPSKGLDFIKNVLKIKLPCKLPSFFPKDDKEFIQDVLSAACKLNFICPIHFYLTLKNVYTSKSKKMNDWLSIVDLWLNNGKYSYSNTEGIELVLIWDGLEYIGKWNYLTEIFETDSVEIEEITSLKIAELLSKNKLIPFRSVR